MSSHDAIVVRRTAALRDLRGYPRIMAGFPVRRLRLRPGEEHREVLSLALEPLAFGGETYVASPSEVPAELVVQPATTGDQFGGTVSTRLEGPCLRCLAPAVVPVEVDAREYEATDAADDEELRSEYVSDGELDVAAWARDQVALGVSGQILCRPDCACL